MSEKKTRTLDEVKAEVEARIKSNETALMHHPDLGTRIKAEARMEAYRLVAGLLSEVVLSQKEPGTCSRCGAPDLPTHFAPDGFPCEGITIS